MIQQSLLLNFTKGSQKVVIAEIRAEQIILLRRLRTLRTNQTQESATANRRIGRINHRSQLQRKDSIMGLALGNSRLGQRLHLIIYRTCLLRRRISNAPLQHAEDSLAVRDRRLHDRAVQHGPRDVFDLRVEGWDPGVRVWLGEVVQHALAARGMAHQGDLAAAEFVHFVAFDVFQTLGDLVRVAVEMAEAPGLVGGCEVEGEEGPFGLL